MWRGAELISPADDNQRSISGSAEGQAKACIVLGKYTTAVLAQLRPWSDASPSVTLTDYAVPDSPR
jgi:hypothetical protein